jgi:hypothetical protein
MRDAIWKKTEFPSDYPNTPSGGFIRSFVRTGNDYVVTPERMICRS